MQKLTGQWELMEGGDVVQARHEMRELCRLGRIEAGNSLMCHPERQSTSGHPQYQLGSVRDEEPRTFPRR